VGSGLSFGNLLSVRGLRGASHEVNVHHGDEAGTQRMMKNPLPGVPNIEVVL
jgi:hypothetical protein